MSEEIRIYVADLAAYNNGKLHGVWIDATLEVKDIHAQVKTMLEGSPEEGAEEYAIHDYERFSGYHLEQYTSIETAHGIACFIDAHGELGGAVLSHWCGDLEDANRAMEEDYCGRYTSLADYAQELTEETTQIPEHLCYYIDYESMARDMELNGDIYTVQTAHNEIHVFWSR